MTRRRLGVAAALVDGTTVPGDVAIEDGRISAVGVAPPGPGGTLAVPGFIDLQVNGFAGVDFSACDLDGYRHASAALAATGVTSFLATLPSTAPDRYRPALAVAAAAHAAGGRTGAAAALRPHPHTTAGGLGGARALGLHLEGPFLAPGRAGAHRPDWLRPADRGLADELLAAGPVRLVTLAPEIDGGLDLLAHLVGCGVAVSLGHSDADAATAQRAFDLGASAVTHLWNAHSPVTARRPGLGGVALARPDVTVCVIADLVHLAAETLRFTLAAAAGRLVVVSDAVVPAGLPDGRYTFGERPVDKLAGAVRLAAPGPCAGDGQDRGPGAGTEGSTGTLAGSACPLDQALRNLVQVGAPVAEALATVTARPATLLGRADLGRLALGGRADVVVLDDRLEVRRTLVDGVLVAGPES